MTKPGLPWRDFNANVVPHLREIMQIDGVRRVSTDMQGGLRRAEAGHIRYGRATLVVEISDSDRADLVRAEVIGIVGKPVPVVIKEHIRGADLGL